MFEETCATPAKAGQWATRQADGTTNRKVIAMRQNAYAYAWGTNSD